MSKRIFFEFFQKIERIGEEFIDRHNMNYLEAD